MTAATLARDAAIETAESHADPEWMRSALVAVKACAEELHEFTSDDIHRCLSFWGKWTHDTRALGGVMRAAVRSGICEPTGIYRKSVRTACHARPVLVYRGKK